MVEGGALLADVRLTKDVLPSRIRCRATQGFDSCPLSSTKGLSIEPLVWEIEWHDIGGSSGAADSLSSSATVS